MKTLWYAVAMVAIVLAIFSGVFLFLVMAGDIAAGITFVAVFVVSAGVGFVAISKLTTPPNPRPPRK